MLEEQLPPKNQSNLETLQVDIDTWRILKKALRTSLSDRGLLVGENEASFMTRFMLEQIESSGLRVVPAKPTSAMQQAVKQALDKGKRMSVAWVKQRTKQRWRYRAAIDAAPSWRRGYEEDRKEAADRAET